MLLYRQKTPLFIEEHVIKALVNWSHAEKEKGALIHRCHCQCQSGTEMPSNPWCCSHLDSVGSILSTRTKSALAAPLYSSEWRCFLFRGPQPRVSCCAVPKSTLICVPHRPRGLPYTLQYSQLCWRLSGEYIRRSKKLS